MRRLNLGSGGRPVKGRDWINVDVDPGAKGLALVANIGEGLPFQPETVDEIRAFDVLEHFSYHDASWVLQQWIGLLRPGGCITVRVPHLDEITTAFAERRLGLLRAVQLLYGGQSTPWDYHYTGINLSWLQGQLYWYGCEKVFQQPDWYKYALKVKAVKQVVPTRGWLKRNFVGQVQ